MKNQTIEPITATQRRWLLDRCISEQAGAEVLVFIEQQARRVAASLLSKLAARLSGTAKETRGVSYDD